MVELVGIFAAEKALEFAVLGSAASLQVEVLIPAAIALSVMMTVHAVTNIVKKHKEEKRQKEEAVQKEIEREELLRVQNEEEIKSFGAQSEAIEGDRLEVEREARIEAFKDMKQNGTPDEKLLYPPGVLEEIERLKRQEDEARRKEEEAKQKYDPSINYFERRFGPRPVPDPDPDPNGGDGPNGGGDGPNDQDDQANPYDDIQGRRRPIINPYQEKLKDAGSRLVNEFISYVDRKIKAEKDEKEGKISAEEKQKIDDEVEQGQQHLEAQKSMLDILEAVGLQELTQEEGVAELDIIQEDLKKIYQQNAPIMVNSVYSASVDSF